MRLTKGDRVQIFIKKFGQSKSLGVGEYIGKERIWVTYSDGARSEFVEKFKVKNTFIYGNSCEWYRMREKS